MTFVRRYGCGVVSSLVSKRKTHMYPVEGSILGGFFSTRLLQTTLWDISISAKDDPRLNFRFAFEFQDPTNIMAGTKTHHCPGKKCLPGNCRMVGKGDMKHCSTHQVRCAGTMKNGDRCEAKHLKKEECGVCGDRCGREA